MVFYCDTCGKELTVDEGTLSWSDDDNCIREFRITHKHDQDHSCAQKDVGYVHLWIVVGISGFIKFNERLTDYWAKGYTLKDPNGLKKALSQIGAYIWEKSKIQA
ncbi:MAG: hypothetical protein PHT62_10530 [Desulfotomaculaceae bacterium]|nr:hypothetical protein [Desulfotomaculaceae bacterium]